MKNNQLAFAAAFLVVSLVCVNHAACDTFGSGENLFELSFVEIGDPGNTPDTTNVPNDRPYGSVPYVYRIGKYEVSTDMLNKANAEGNLNIYHQGSEEVPIWWRYEPDMPAYFVSWYGAATFVNWLNESKFGYPAYKFDSEGNFQLWEPGELGYDSANPFRNSLSQYVLPTADEWFKAAYYDGENDVYYDYPTGSNALPDGIDFEGDEEFEAVFNDGFEGTRPNEFMNVGIPSAYGTYGQGGNVWEWEETAKDYENSAPDEDRAVNGGDWDNGSSLGDPNSLWYLGKWHRNGPADPLTRTGIGLRVVSLAPPPLPYKADFNRDFDVDGSDFLAWQTGYGIQSGALLTDGDSDNDYDVDFDDLLGWQGEFGMGYVVASIAVPEPTSTLLIMIVFASEGFLSRRFCRSI